MKFVFLKKKNYLILSQYHDLHVHSSKTSKGSWMSGPQTSGLPNRDLKLTQVDSGGGNIKRNKSRIFVLFLYRKPKPKVEFCGSALFYASQPFHTDGSGLRIRHFHPIEGTEPSSCAALSFLNPSIFLCSRRNENEKLILKPSIGRLKKKKTDKTTKRGKVK